MVTLRSIQLVVLAVVVAPIVGLTSPCTDAEIEITLSAKVRVPNAIDNPLVVRKKDGFVVTIDESNVRQYITSRKLELESKQLQTNGLERLKAQLFNRSGRQTPIAVKDLGPSESDWGAFDTTLAVLHAVEVSGLIAHGFLGPLTVVRSSDGATIVEIEIQEYLASDEFGNISGMRVVTNNNDVVYNSCYVDPK